jgi:hypothetical protein
MFHAPFFSIQLLIALKSTPVLGYQDLAVVNKFNGLAFLLNISLCKIKEPLYKQYLKKMYFRKMDTQLSDQINVLIAQEQTLQSQLLTVQQQKTKLQTVLSVWNDCASEASFYNYVLQVTQAFTSIYPAPTPPTTDTTNGSTTV